MSKKEFRLPEGLDVETATDVLREFATTGEAQIVSSDRLDALQNEIAEAKEAFAAVLAEESPQSADALARQDMDALTEPYRDDDGDIDVDTLRQVPETGDTGGDGGDGSGDGDGFDAGSIDFETRDRLDTLAKKRSSFESRDMDGRVADIEAEMVDVSDAPDFDTLQEEVL